MMIMRRKPMIYYQSASRLTPQDTSAVGPRTTMVGYQVLGFGDVLMACWVAELWG